ncbi:hypothetical protein ACEWY4_013362 [Coilia grayii]|uniref:THAP-type domain-containing protein n=1 Tax=Coilia grayii TaxID=363190 RepID=A0ABD1JW59_9TELE
MVCCFVPCCNHVSGRSCKFYRFPADNLKRRRWARVVGRCDRAPTITSRLCSCHFPEGKERGPILFTNKDGTVCTEHKIPRYRPPRPVQKDVPAAAGVSASRLKSTNQPQTAITIDDGPPSQSFIVSDISPADSVIIEDISPEEALMTTYIIPVESVISSTPIFTKTTLRSPHVATQTELPNFERLENILLQAQLKDVREETRALKQKLKNFQSQYTPSRLSDEVVRMETGLPDRDCFNKVVECAVSLESSVNYRAGWKVKSLSIEDQVFLTLMKLKHNYKDFHLGALFSCGEGTIKNVTQTWTEVLRGLLDDSTPSPRGVKAQKKPNNHRLNTDLQTESATCSDYLSNSNEKETCC